MAVNSPDADPEKYFRESNWGVEKNGADQISAWKNMYEKISGHSSTSIFRNVNQHDFLKFVLNHQLYSIGTVLCLLFLYYMLYTILHYTISAMILYTKFHLLFIAFSALCSIFCHWSFVTDQPYTMLWFHTHWPL